MVWTSAKKLINIVTFCDVILSFFFTLYLSLVYTVNYFYLFPVLRNTQHKNHVPMQMLIVPDEGWFAEI